MGTLIPLGYLKKSVVPPEAVKALNVTPSIGVGY
jgi:hypothetical protein